MNLTSLALLLVLLAMLFAIFTQRLLLSTNTDIYDPIATKLEDVRNGFSGMKESIVSKLDHYRDVIDRKHLLNMPTRITKLTKINLLQLLLSYYRKFKFKKLIKIHLFGMNDAINLP